MTVSFQKLRYKNLSNWSVAHLLANQFNYNEDFKLERIGNFLLRNKTQISVDDNTIYKRVTIRLYNKGVKLRDTEIGKKIGTKKQFIIKQGQFLMSKIDARNGAFGIATEEVDGAIITADFFAYDIDETKILPQFLVLLTTTKQFQRFAQSASSGTTGRQRMDEKKFLDVKIPLPSIKKQNEIIDKYLEKVNQVNILNALIEEKSKQIEETILSTLSISKSFNDSSNKILQFSKFSTLTSWGVNKLLLNKEIYKSDKYHLQPLRTYCTLIRGVTYKKSSELPSGGYKVLRANNINLDNTLNFDEIKYISKTEQFSDEKKLRKNDVFICLASGSKKHIGKVVFIDEDMDYYFGGFMGVIRINSEVLMPDYLNLILNTSLFNDYLSSKIFGSNINNLNSELLYDFKIPIPSKDLQTDLINLSGKMKSEIINLKAQIQNNNELAISQFEQEIFN